MQVGCACNACLPEANLHKTFITQILMDRKIPAEKHWSLSRKYTSASSKKTMLKHMMITIKVTVGRVRLRWEGTSPIFSCGRVFQTAEQIMWVAISKKMLSGSNHILLSGKSTKCRTA